MGSNKIRGNDLKKINYTNDKCKSVAITISSRHYKHLSKIEKLELLSKVLKHPDHYLNHEFLSPLAQALEGKSVEAQDTVYSLTDQSLPYRIFGSQHIGEEAIKQMDLAMRLPVAVAGALMPDAHAGYGLPIGGVLAADNAVIPYGVGMDIGCRMALTLFEAEASFFKKNDYLVKTALKENTTFGMGKEKTQRNDHPVLESDEFSATPLLRKLHGVARLQLGSSGSGNHFVELGVVELDNENPFHFPAGNYVGLLSHSGSRGLGAEIARQFTKIAIEKCMLPKGAAHMAWLNLDKAEGAEYWHAMQLAGDFAAACHDVIHQRMAKALDLKPIAKVENHHNFAWKETYEGRVVVVHRKGATPAGRGQLGIIPASMTKPGYIVEGLGEASSINSAAHGAGRKYSRQKARKTLTGSAMKKELRQAGVTLIGGGLDEAPLAYKNLEEVMACQKALVKPVGRFFPKIVRMDKN